MKNFLQLLRSMRFAITILTVVAIASAIGSVLQQSQPYVVYISRYGEFWTELFRMAGLLDLYHAWWFFLLLAFMATSTALCLAQNTPGMLREIRGYRELKSLQSLRKVAHCSELDFTLPAAELQQRLADFLRRHGFRFRRTQFADGGYLLAAKTGSMRRLGYLLVHSAIVVVCIGGLIDGNVGLRVRMLMGDLQVETRDLPPSAVPARSRLAADSGSYRAAMSLVEGSTHDSAYLSFNDGYLLQELPFAIHLKHFRVEHYASGQPKDFASDIEIVDGKRRIPVTLQVNHPFTYRGVTIYQSGFADGGTVLRMKAQRLDDTAAATPFSGKVGDSNALLIDGQPVTIEFTDFRPTNVFENKAEGESSKIDWFTQAATGNRMRDVGASLAFKLRDQSGQADDWNVYMKPIAFDHARYFVIGKRAMQSGDWQYVRLPLDSSDSLASYRRFAAGLKNEAARKTVARIIGGSAKDPKVASALEESTAMLMKTFADSGLRGVATLVQASVPPAEQAKAASLYLELLERAALLLQDGGAHLASDSAATRLMRDSLQAYSASLEAKLNFFFELDSFTPVNASGLQLTRAPGALMVYLGCALLTLGVCTMYFIRERRLWLHVAPASGKLLVAYAANRDSPTLPAEFETYRAAIVDLTDPKR